MTSQILVILLYFSSVSYPMCSFIPFPLKYLFQLLVTGSCFLAQIFSLSFNLFDSCFLIILQFSFLSNVCIFLFFPQGNYSIFLVSQSFPSSCHLIFQPLSFLLPLFFSSVSYPKQSFIFILPGIYSIHLLVVQVVLVVGCWLFPS